MSFNTIVSLCTSENESRMAAIETAHHDLHGPRQATAFKGVRSIEMIEPGRRQRFDLNTWNVESACSMSDRSKRRGIDRLQLQAITLRHNIPIRG